MKAKIRMVGFEYQDSTETKEICRNLTALISTPEGTCAGDRSYGLSQSFVDLPAMQAANELALELAEKIRLYEPRADLSEVTCTADLYGGLVATITIVPGEGYDEDEDDEDEDGEEEEDYV